VVLVILLATAAILTKLQSIDKDQQYKLAWQEVALARVRRPGLTCADSPAGCATPALP
jgi:hypothetical protein